VLRPAPPSSEAPHDERVELNRTAADAPPAASDSDVISVTCDAAGHFACARLPAGRWRVQVEVRDAKHNALFEIELDDEEVRDDLVWTVGSGFVVEGFVVDRAGAPIAKAKVTLFDVAAPRLSQHGHPVRFAEASTDEQGRFRFMRVGRRQFRLQVEPWPPRSFGGSRTLLRTIDHVAAGTRNLRVDLPEGGVIAGSVVDAKGAPASGVWVCACDDNDAIIARSKVEPDGRFELLLDPDAVVRVEVRPYGLGSHGTRGNPGVEPLAVAVNVVPDDEPLSLTIAPK
jgi:hypothetical protein